MRRSRVRGFSVARVVVFLVVVAGGYIGWAGYQRKQAKAEHQAAVAQSEAALMVARDRWMDGMRLATSTSRIALAVPVSTLQGIKQGVEALQVPKCLDANKQAMLRGMGHGLDAIMTFMRAELPTYELDEFTRQRAESMASALEEAGHFPTVCSMER